jgi:hypothetical protein
MITVVITPSDAVTPNVQLKKKLDSGIVAQACNPSYSGDRDGEDCGSRPKPRQKVLEIPSQPITELGGTRLSSQPLQESLIGGSSCRLAWHSARPCLKITNDKGGVLKW